MRDEIDLACAAQASARDPATANAYLLAIALALRIPRLADEIRGLPRLGCLGTTLAREGTH